MEPQSPEGSDVLIVEDQPELRESLADLLELEGYRVDTAANGQEALTRLQRASPPQVILLDLRMPVMDGWAFRHEQQQSAALFSCWRRSRLPRAIRDTSRRSSARRSDCDGSSRESAPPLPCRMSGPGR